MSDKNRKILSREGSNGVAVGFGKNGTKNTAASGVGGPSMTATTLASSWSDRLDLLLSAILGVAAIGASASTGAAGTAAASGCCWRIRTSRMVLMMASFLYFAYLIVLHRKLPNNPQPPPASTLLNTTPRLMSPSGGGSVGEFSLSDNNRHNNNDVNDGGGGSVVDVSMLDPLRYGYTSLQEMENRKSRFPSVDDRVKVYMSNWYLPPCEDNVIEGKIQYKFKSSSSTSNNQTTTTTTLLVRELPNVNDALGNSNNNNNNGMSSAGSSSLSSVVDRRVFLLRGDVEMATIFFLQRQNMEGCALGGGGGGGGGGGDSSPGSSSGNDFCIDTMKYLIPALDEVTAGGSATTTTTTSSRMMTSSQSSQSIPTLLQFGDSENMRLYIPGPRTYGTHPNIPIIRKFRRAYSRESITAMTAPHCIRANHGREIIQQQQHRHLQQQRETTDNYDAASIGDNKGKSKKSSPVAKLQPIVWKLTEKRHYGMLDEIPLADVPWNQKQNRAIWRGGLTGIHKAGLTNIQLDKLSSKEKCELMHRCKLVLQSNDSKLIDAKLVGGKKYKGLPPVIDNVEIFGKKLEYGDMLQYKAIIMLEGNDISSGFKWAMYSRSVVMTQRPTLTSWAMEELLIPWIHYVPLADDLSDVEEKMTWVLQNDFKAQQIAHRGSLWIKDLMFHPQATIDDESIYKEMMRRYQQHFVYDPNLFFFG